MKSVGTLVSEPKEKKQSHERDKEVSKSWSFNITSIHFFHAISYLCFNILLLGTITNLLAKNVGKVKGCLRWRHGRKEKKKGGRCICFNQSIFNLFFSVLSCHGALLFQKMSYMDMGEQSSFLEVTLVHEMGAVYSKKDIKYRFVIFLVNIFLGPIHYFSI